MSTIEMLSKDVVVSRFLEHCRRNVYPAKHVIIAEGDQSYDLYYLISGSVTVSIEDDSGREIILAYLNDGEFFGEIGLFNEEHNRSAFVKARTKCEIAKISYEKLKQLHALSPDLLFHIAGQMARRLSKTGRKVRDLAFTDVKGRIAKTLLDLCKEPDAMTHPDGMQIRITRQELAKIVSCSREMAGRALKSMEEEALVSVVGKTIVVFGAR